MMKLNPDSVRAVLLYVEKFQTFDTRLSSFEIAQNIFKNDGICNGSEDDLIYAVKQLVDNCMIDAFKVNLAGSTTPNFIIKDITPIGHEFIANIHDDNAWNKTKEKAKTIGSWSITTLSEIAKQLIASAILGS